MPIMLALLGYSSGAWAALGLLNHHPERLHSVVLGGWHLKNGLPEMPEGKLSFNMFMSYAASTAPELNSRLSLNDKESIRCFFNELVKYSDKKEALFPYKTPILLWAGASDLCNSAMGDIAQQYGLSMIPGKGDHLSEFNNPDKASINEIFRFFEMQDGSMTSVTSS